MNKTEHLENQMFAFYDAIIEQSYRDRTSQSKNPLNSFGKKSFSQADEDGITIEICRRLGLNMGHYCEYGVGDGLECNTLVLAALGGWKGFWVSGEKIKLDTSLIDSSIFSFYKEWVTSKNVVSLFHQGCQKISRKDVDVISMDLDGNDLSFTSLLLENKIYPKLFIVEYNGKFIPPIMWSVNPDDKLKWKSTDYYGASLQSFVNLFEHHNYSLVCCNAWTGCNAFFVHNAYSDKFLDVPKNINDIFQPINCKLISKYGHRKDKRVVYEIFRRIK